MKLKKYLGYAALAAALYWIITSPTDAADFVHRGFVLLGDVAEGLTSFANALT